MKLDMKLGAEPKKVAILGALVVVALVVFYMNSSPSGPDTSYTPPAATPAPSSAPGAQLPSPVASTSGRAKTKAGVEFRPSVRPKRGEQRPDPMSIDPTLRLDMLARLQSVNVEGSHRSVFDFSQAPAPPQPAQAKIVKQPVPNPIVPVQQANAEPAQPAQPPAPVAPPIPLKFYGYVHSQGGHVAKRAFFVEGEDIHVVHEGELVKKRYKIIRIGINSVVVEDVQFGSQQTLPLEEQQQG